MTLITRRVLELQERADALNRQFAGKKSVQILDALLNGQVAGNVAVVSSFGAEAAVLLKMVADKDPTTPVVFLDTRRHFPETLTYVDDLMDQLGLTTLVRARPRPGNLAAEDPDTDLAERDSDRCCYLRKTLPMISVLRHYDCILTGRKRFQTDDRSTMDVVEVQETWLRANPLASWDLEDIQTYLQKHELLRHPLVSQGFSSIGCEPCTEASDDYRAGRWADKDKTECGIHITEDGRIVRKGGRGKRLTAQPGSQQWVILTPVFLPAPGGGAVYSDVLARALARAGHDVLIVPERFPGEPDSEFIDCGAAQVRIERTFPFRAGRAKRDWRSYRDYLRQQLRMRSLPSQLRKWLGPDRPDNVVILVHSSFFYNFTTLTGRLDALRGIAPSVTLLVDVRDPLFSDDLLPLFRRFDGAVACSRSIARRLEDAIGDRVDVAEIPIPFAPSEPAASGAVEDVLARHGLSGARYVFNPNGVTADKNYPLILETVRHLRQVPGFADVQLVSIGRSRDWCARDDAARDEGLLNHLGLVPNADATMLAQGALATLVLGEKEGFPRSALESLALGKCVLVPALPEFVETIPGHVASSKDPAELASQLAGLISNAAPPAYPVERHDIESLVPRYLALAGQASNQGGQH